MKFTYKPSPNYRSAKSTSEIMKDLTLCLLAVVVYAVIYYSANYGASYGLKVVLMLACGVVSALVTDAVYFWARKQDIKKSILTSYSWVTGIILVLMTNISISYYAIIVCTVIAVFFGKLVFGGFGQNIFNPAAFGEAVLMNTFSGTTTDFTTGATPTTVAKSAGWMFDAGTIASQYGGLGKMFLGQYPSTIGSTCALLLVVCLVFLLIEKDIDWQTPVFYIGTFFLESLIIGLIKGAGVSYALFSVLAGGILFGGVFMVTDPVTSPVTIPGRIVYAIGCASFTFIIRTMSNLSDGVLYAILLMNMLTPAIDKIFDGNQIKNASKICQKAVIVSAVIACLTVIIGTCGLNSVTKKASTTTSTDSEGVSGTFEGEAQGINGDPVITTITLENGVITNVEVVGDGETEGIGTKAIEELPAKIVEANSADVDVVSGATVTSQAIIDGAKAALEAAGN